MFEPPGMNQDAKSVLRRYSEEPPKQDLTTKVDPAYGPTKTYRETHLEPPRSTEWTRRSITDILLRRRKPSGDSEKSSNSSKGPHRRDRKKLADIVKKYVVNVLKKDSKKKKEIHLINKSKIDKKAEPEAAAGATGPMVTEGDNQKDTGRGAPIPEEKVAVDNGAADADCDHCRGSA